MTQVTSDQAAEERQSKRKTAMGINPDGSKQPRGKFKPKGPPASWKQLATQAPPHTALREKSASALKNFLTTYTYEKVPKSSSKQKLVDVIVGLFAQDE
jgi:hypothetical protein